MSAIVNISCMLEMMRWIDSVYILEYYWVFPYNISCRLEMMKRIDSSDHLRLSIVPGKNNLSGILWMWNPLMRFLLFLHYTHIVSARWGPLVGQGRPRAGIVRGNHQAGWHTGPRLKFSFLGNQFRDQGSKIEGSKKGTTLNTPCLQLINFLQNYRWSF